MKHKPNASKTKTPSKSTKFVAQVRKQETRPAVISSIRYSRITTTSQPTASQQYYHYGIQ